jgi:hypothetical protein
MDSNFGLYTFLTKNWPKKTHPTFNTEENFFDFVITAGVHFCSISMFLYIEVIFKNVLNFLHLSIHNTVLYINNVFYY